MIAAVCWLLVVSMADGVAQPAAKARDGSVKVPRPPRDARITATWTGIELGALGGRLGDVCGRPVVIDRRIDPQSRISLVATEMAPDAVLESVARQAGASCAILPEVIRITPQGTAARLVAADVRRRREISALPGTLRDLATARAPWSWPAGTTPRDLLSRLATDSELELLGLEQLPHDHFPAANLPPLPLADRLDLLLAHFDMRVAWKSVRLPQNGQPLCLNVVPIDGPAAQRSDSPDATENVHGGTVVVKAPGSRLTVPAPQTAPTTQAAPAGDTFSLTVAAPLEQLLITVAMRLGLDLKLDREQLRAKGIAAGEIVRVEIHDASRDALLDAIVAPLDLVWEIRAGALVVGPRP